MYKIAVSSNLLQIKTHVCLSNLYVNNQHIEEPQLLK